VSHRDDALETRIDRLAFQREHAEDALVDAVEGLLLDESVEGFEDVALAALRDYLRTHRGGINALVEAARADRVYTVMRPYLEALA
jgi:hypothetical protein